MAGNKAVVSKDDDTDEQLPDSPEEDDAQNSDHRGGAKDEGQQDEQQGVVQQGRSTGAVSEKMTHYNGQLLQNLIL